MEDKNSQHTEDKDSQLYIVESYFENEEEREARAVIPSTAHSPLSLGNHSNEVFNNSHHSNVRRSTDDREEDLFLEEQNQLHFEEFWYSVPPEERLDKAGSFEGLDVLPSSSGTSADNDELKQLIPPSTRGLVSSSPTLRPLANQSQTDGIYNSQFASRYSDDQEVRLDHPASLGGRDDLPSSSRTSTDNDELKRSITPSTRGLVSSSPTLRPLANQSQTDGIYNSQFASRYSDDQEVRLDHPASLGGRDDLPSSSGTSTDHDELKRSITPSTRGVISSSPSLQYQLNGVDNNSQHFRYYSDGQAGLPASLGGQVSLSSASGISTKDPEQTIDGASEKVSLQCTSDPQQERGSNVRDSLVCGIVKKEAKSPVGGCVDDESCPGDLQQTLCNICLFKRRIIARDELEYALYFIPQDKFREVFPKVKKDEALVYHGTEFPMDEEHRALSNHCLLHRRLEIACNSQVSFQVVHGQNFSIMGPCLRTVTLAEIHSKSKERIAAGFSVKVLVKCTGGKDMLYEDRIRVVLQSGSAILHLIFPIAYYEASISPRLHDSPVTCMPKEDREALRSCYVELLENIGDAISLCEHLYQYKILDSDDLDEIRNIPKKKDRNAYVLHTIQSRGNILDFVIKIMQVKRENQGAAAILQKRRYHGTEM